MLSFLYSEEYSPPLLSTKKLLFYKCNSDQLPTFFFILSSLLGGCNSTKSNSKQQSNSKPKVAIAEFFLENAKKNLVFYFGGGHCASFPQKPVINVYLIINNTLL